jgi:hypothetical protein
MKTSKGIDFVKVTVVFLLLGILVAAFLVNFVFKKDLLTITMFLGLAAILGSAVNESSRQQSELGDASRLDKSVFLSWKLLVAIVFALFLYVAFLSGVIKGPLFPEFQGTDGEPYLDMMDFMTKCKPKTNLDTAKALVWAFIAGYAERFVPNLIQELEKKKPETPS